MQSPRHLAIVIAVLAFLVMGISAVSAAETAPLKKRSLIVVLIYDDSCKIACTVVKPVVRELAEQRADQVQYVELNAGTASIKESLKKADELKIKTFVEDRTEEVPVVGIFSAKGKMLKELVGHKTKEVYKQALESSLQKVSK